MPDVLLKYVRHPYIAAPAALDESADDQFRSIINILRAQTGTDFQPYKRGTLGRRILRRMGLRHLISSADYVDLLRKDGDEVQNLFKDLLIGVTSFFRDAEAWEVLDREVIRPLVRNKTPGDTIPVWVAGCATGEEAYSVAMLMHEQMEEQQKNLVLQIFASDLDERAIKTARAALYPEGVAADVGTARLKRFFTPENGQYRVAKRVRESVVCAPQNLLSDPPFSKLDLITAISGASTLNRPGLLRLIADAQARRDPALWALLLAHRHAAPLIPTEVAPEVGPLPRVQDALLPSAAPAAASSSLCRNVPAPARRSSARRDCLRLPDRAARAPASRARRCGRSASAPGRWPRGRQPPPRSGRRECPRPSAGSARRPWERTPPRWRRAAA
jgi:chemotaxis methyl-accepting protein methylase